MGLKVYGLPMSTCTAQVLVCLRELAAHYEFIQLNVQAQEHKQPVYLATKNPFGPVIEDGDFTLFEPRAITRYLATKFREAEGATPLLGPSKDEEEALVNVWLEVESQNFNQPISEMLREIILMPFYGFVPDAGVLKANAEKLGKVQDVYERRLSKSKYLVGDFYSLADLHHLPNTNYLMKTAHAELVDSRPFVKAWWEDISSRPEFKKVAEGIFAV